MLTILMILSVFLIGFLVVFFVVGLLALLVFHMPYYLWLERQNSKGLLLDLKDVPFGRQLINTAKWWKSIFTRRPAF